MYCFVKYLKIFLLALILGSCSKTNVVEVLEIKEKEEINEKEEEENNLTSLYVATDLHYLSSYINDKGDAFQKMVKSSDGRALLYVEEITEAFKNQIIDEKPEALIISGDLTHNGEKESHIAMAKKFKEIKQSGVKVFVVPGNHDINNPYARKFEGNNQIKTDFVSPDEFKEIYFEYGYKDAIMKDDDTLSYLAVVDDNLWVLMLDTNIYNDNSTHPVTNGKLSQKTLLWIKECGSFAKNNNAEIVVAMHHNLYNHSDLLYKGFTIDNAHEVLEVFKECEFQVVLSGHVHIQDIKSDESNFIFDIVTSGFIVYPIQYGILSYNNSQFLYETKKVNVEKWAKNLNLNNEDLLNFNEYSKNYFYNQSLEKIFNELLKSGYYSKDDTRAMAETLALLNVNYFGGTIHLVLDDVKASRGYELWLEYEDSFLRDYIVSMVNVEEDYYNYFQLPAK